MCVYLLRSESRSHLARGHWRVQVRVEIRLHKQGGWRARARDLAAVRSRGLASVESRAGKCGRLHALCPAV